MAERNKELIAIELAKLVYEHEKTEDSIRIREMKKDTRLYFENLYHECLAIISKADHKK